MKTEIKVILKSVLLMCLTTWLLMAVVSWVYYLFHIETTDFRAGILVTYFLSALPGGFVYGGRKEKNRFLYGIVMGTLYFTIIFFISLVCHPGADIGSKEAAEALICCLFGGMVGGMARN